MIFRLKWNFKSLDNVYFVLDSLQAPLDIGEKVDLACSFAKIINKICLQLLVDSFTYYFSFPFCFLKWKLSYLEILNFLSYMQ